MSAGKRGNGGHERWLVSYADFITLLFAFFVVLYSVAKSQKHTEAQVSESIHTAFDELARLPQFSRRPGPGLTIDAYVPAEQLAAESRVAAPAEARRELENVRARLNQALQAQIATHVVSLRMGPDGLVISLHEAGFFDTGSAAPLSDSLPVIQEIGTSLRTTPYQVRVEGHTDNVPIHTDRYSSNWELSAARATSIARLLLDQRGIPPGHLSAAGYGEYHPVASNDSAAGRAANRRVDLVVYPRVSLGGDSPKLPARGGTWERITEGDMPEAQQHP